MPRQEESWSDKLLKKKPPLFWWILANILAFCIALSSWLFFLHVFNHPDIAQNYQFLQSIQRAPQIASFSALEAPKGSTSDPKNLHAKYYNISQEERNLLNRQLLRNYLANYKDTLLNTYLRGQFQVMETRPLNQDDFMTQGIVLQAQAFIQPDTYLPPTPYLVVIELILPSAPARAAEQIHPGDMIEIDKSPHFTSILHTKVLERQGDEPIIYLTAVPLVYDFPYTPPRGEAFYLDPPKSLNLEASLPILKPNF